MISILRTVGAAAVACSLSVPAWAALPDPGMWSIGSELNGKPGRGIQIDRQSGLTVIVTYFGYRTDGSSLFLQAAGALKNGAVFEGELTEFRNGRVLAGSPSDGEPAQVVGPVRIVFDSATTATITLPGEAPQPLTRFRFEDHVKRLNDFTFSYATTHGFVSAREPQGTLTFKIKDRSFEMQETLSGGGTCDYAGTLDKAGAGINSSGELRCTALPGKVDYTRYRMENLEVDERGVLTGRIHWLGTYEGGSGAASSRGILGVCQAPFEFLGPSACLDGGKTFYDR